jgi:glyoxylase-like metal-dependent hydrolase (beta-lactamase superfamily II)
MVDPPPFSGTSLREFGIPPNIIDKIIITHCHADHDAGSFQKILMAHQVEVRFTI